MRTCAYCRLHLDPEVHGNARYHPHCRKQGAALGKKQRRAQVAEENVPEEWLRRNRAQLTEAASKILALAPHGADGYILELDWPKRDNFQESEKYIFPEWDDRTLRRLRWDRTFAYNSYFSLDPFEYPRVPADCTYTVIYVKKTGERMIPRYRPPSFKNQRKGDGVGERKGLPRQEIDTAVVLPGIPMTWKRSKNAQIIDLKAIIHKAYIRYLSRQ